MHTSIFINYGHTLFITSSQYNDDYTFAEVARILFLLYQFLIYWIFFFSICGFSPSKVFFNVILCIFILFFYYLFYFFVIGIDKHFIICYINQCLQGNWSNMVEPITNPVTNELMSKDWWNPKDCQTNPKHTQFFCLNLASQKIHVTCRIDHYAWDHDPMTH